MLVICAAAAISSLAHVEAQSESYTWRNVNIGGGGFVTGTVFHPAEPGLVYTRTDVGGAYRFDNAAAQWIPLNDEIGGRDNEFHYLGVISIGLDPNDANRVYLACGQYTGTESWWRTARIYRSTDRGATWAFSETPFKVGGNEEGRGTGERLAVDPVNGANILVGSSTAGIWRSTDYGVTWSQLSGFPSALTHLNFLLYAPANHANPGPNRRVYAGVRTLNGQSLWFSDNNGTTWAEVPNHPGKTSGSEMMPLQGSFGADGVFYTTWGNETGPGTMGSRNGVWKLSANAANWTKIQPPTGSGWSGPGNFGGISADPRTAGHVVVSTLHRWGSEEIYRSTDGGATWTGVLMDGTRSAGNSPWSSSVYAHWITDVDIDPFDSERVIFNNGFGLIQTTNLTASGAARTWTFFCDGLEELVPLGLFSPAAGPPLVSVVGDYTGFRHDHLFRSPRRGTHQPTIGTTYNISGAQLAPGRILRQGNAQTYYSQDAGATWSAFPALPAPAINGHLRAAIGADGQRIVWCPPNSPAFVSTNNGTTWTQSSGSTSLINVSGTPTYDVLAGAAGVAGSANATGGSARFNSPSAIAVDRDGIRCVADTGNHVIRRITTFAQVSTLAGTAGQQGSTDAVGSAARFRSPAGIAADSAGNTYVADTGNHVIRKITGDGTVTTLAGTAGSPGSANGTGSAARFNTPTGLAVDSAGDIYVCDTGNHLIRKVSSSGVVTTVAGSAGSAGSTDGAAADARFNAPRGIAAGSAGILYVADTGNHAIRRIGTDGAVTTLAGSGGTSGTADGTAAAARFNGPRGITVDAAGVLHVADTANHSIRRVTGAGVVTTVAGLSGTPGSTVGNGSTARFNNPGGIVSTPDGINVYVTDTANHIIRRGYTASTLIPIADRTDGNRFYLWDNAAKRLFTSSDGGANFSVVASGMNSSFAEFRNPPGQLGHLWARAGTSGLYRSTDNGTTFTKLASVSEVYAFDFGKAKAGASHPAVFIWGKVGGVTGYFRSDDAGATWIRINDSRTNFGGVTTSGGISTIAGDPRTYGRVYLGSSGRGIIVGNIANPAAPTPQASQLIFDNVLASGWTNTSPAGTSLTSASPTRRGSAAISVSSGSNRAFSVTCAARSVEGFSAIAFWVRGSSGAPPPLQAGIARGGINLEAQPIPVGTSTDWQRVVVPLADVGADGITDLTGLRIESRTVNGVTPGAFSIDDVQLVGLLDADKPVSATITLSDLNQIYDGTAKSVTATTAPAGLPVVVTYEVSATAPSLFGSYAVSAVIDDPFCAGSATGTLTITAPLSRTVALANWIATSSSLSASGTESPLWNPTNAASGLNGATHAFYSPIQLAAPGDTLTLSGSVAVQVNPASPPVGGRGLWFRYGLFRNQSTVTLPSSPVTDWLGYCGMLNATAALYERTGSGHYASSFSGATARTPQISSAGQNSSSNSITIAFQQRITRTTNGVDVSYRATDAASGATLMSCTFSDTTPNNNGVLTGAQTNPAAPVYSPTYSAAGFSFSGEYIGTSTASAQFSNVQVNFSSASAGTPQSITFHPLPDRTWGDAPFTLSATASSGLPVTFSIVSGPATVSGNTLTLTGTGNVTVRASQDGGWTYQTAQSDRTFTVNKANATITLSNLNQYYDGTPKAIGVATVPAGLGTTVTYAGSTTPPAAVRAYPVVVTITDAFYQGAATNTLQIINTLTQPPGMSLAIGGGTAAISVPSLLGYLYQLQTSATLAAGDWTNVGPAQPGNGGILLFEPDLQPLNGRRFYRILITPTVP